MNDPHENFSYVFEIRDNPRGPFNGRVVEAFGECLLGPAPEFSWTEYTPTAWKLYARVDLKANGRRAVAAGISLIIDRGLLTVLRPGDCIHLAALPSLGIAIVREGLLIAAAGAALTLARIPLGRNVALTFPDPAGVPLEHPAGALLRPEDVAARPVQVSIMGEPSQGWWRGHPKIGRYDVLIQRGLRDGEPRISMELSRVCPETAAHTSAQLMERDGYQLVER